MSTKIEGRLFTIEWRDAYSEPPAGAPRVLAEVFALGNKPPAEFERIPVSLGGGYCHVSRHIAPPGKQLSPEALARVRRKRLARRVTAKVPMFADFFIEQEQAKKPEFYNGITDAALQAAHDDVLAREAERYVDLLSRIDKVVIYAQEPPECREKAERLRAEMQALVEASAARKSLQV